MTAVDSFRPYLRRSWISTLDEKSARAQLFEEVARWSERISVARLTKPFRMNHWKEGESLQVACGGEEYSQLIWFLYRSHYNLYCLATHRKTIEELASGTYAYCSLPYPRKHAQTDEEKAEQKRVLARRKEVFADFRRLLRLSKTFLLAEWVHDMIERAVSNGDEDFFRIMSNSIKTNLLAEPSPAAVQWLLVVLLWFLGGRDMKRQREFLQLLKKEQILPTATTEASFNVTLYAIGLTTT